MASDRDPGRVRLRSALRAAVLAPAVYWLGTYPLDLGPGAIYAAFAVLVLTGFVDFQGRLRDRLTAYLVGALAGGVLIALCGGLSHNRVASVIGAGVLTFVVLYLTILRGYFATAARGLLLPVALAATNWNMSVDTLLRAEAGWALGALASAIGAVVLWPARASNPERTLIATELDLAAEVIEDCWQPPGGKREPDRIQAHLDELTEAQNRLRAAFSVLSRPGAGNMRDRGLMQLVDQLGRLRLVLQVRAESAGTPDVTDADQRLLTATVECLRACARSLRGKGEPPGPQNIARARADHSDQVIELVDRQLADGRAGDLRQLVSRPVVIRLLSSLAELMAVSTDLAVAGRRHDRDRDEADRTDRRISVIETEPTRVMASHLTWKSPWFRNSVRGALAVAAAVAVVAATNAPVGFWVVLGAITALRSSALVTGKTVLQAIAGTIIGLIISSGLVYVTSDTLWIYWALFAPTVFGAVYLIRGRSFVISQAAFTLSVLVVFALVLGPHLQTGEIRLIDVGLGAACSLVLSVLLWPRGIAPQVLLTLKTAINAATANLAAAVDRLVGGAEFDPRAEIVRRQAHRTTRTAFDAFDLSLSNPGEHPIDLHAWTILANIDIELNAAAERIVRVSHPDYSGWTCPGVADDMVATCHSLRARLLTTLDGLPSLNARSVEVLPADTIARTDARTDSMLGDPVKHLFTDLDNCLQQFASGTTPTPDGRSVVLVVWAAEQLEQVRQVALHASRIRPIARDGQAVAS